MPNIDQTISAANPNSESVLGADIAHADSRAQSTLISTQVIPTAEDQDFGVELHMAINSVQGLSWTKIAEWDQASKTLGAVFFISLGTHYRFEHVSGIACRVLLTG